MTTTLLRFSDLAKVLLDLPEDYSISDEPVRLTKGWVFYNFHFTFTRIKPR
jgi:hypothetical protein